MSRAGSPRAIGLFVLGAIGVAVLGVVTFGGGGLFRAGDSYEIQFDESLKGLRLGAPVTFRGVEVGQVQEIRAIYDPGTGAVRVPVTVELRPGALSMGGAGTGGGDVVADLVARGLRARLDLQSIVTGQLLVALDFFKLPPTAGAATPRPGEIPSVTSTWAGLQRTVDEALLNAPEIARTLKELTTALRDLLAGPAGAGLRQSAVTLAALLEQLSDPEGPLHRTMAELPGLLNGLRAGADRLPELVAKLDALAVAGTQLAATGDQRLKAAGEELARLVAAGRRVADQAGGLIADNRDGLKEFTEDGLPEVMGLVQDANRLVNELNGAVRDMRQDPARFFLGDRAGQGVQLP
jgi:paraquat-inducible protein B